MTQQVWFVSGGSRGLGRAVVELALQAGHRVVAASRSGEHPTTHPNLLTINLEVADKSACIDAVTQAELAFGPVDVLVNNAGYGLVCAVEEISEDEARKILDVDLLGALWLTQAVLPGMRKNGVGHIVQVSSTGGVGAMPFLGLYNAAKWGLEGFSEALAGEVSGFGIKVTLAEIGSMDTSWGTSGMQFASPLGDYDETRQQVLGTASVPWPIEPGTTSGGTDPAEIAAALIDHVASDADQPLRLVLGSDAPGQLSIVLGERLREYRMNPLFDL